MSTRRIISFMNPNLSSEELMCFDPTPDNVTAPYTYFCESYVLDPIEGEANKYNMRVGSKVRDYTIRDRKLTIKGVMTLNPNYTGIASRDTSSMKRELSRVLPVGVRSRLNVYRSDENTTPYTTYVYVDSLDIGQEMRSIIKFTVVFLLPDVYFSKSYNVTTATRVLDLEDRQVIVTSEWNNDSDHAGESFITFEGLNLQNTESASIESYLVSAAGNDALKSNIRIINPQLIPSDNGFVFDSQTSEFYPIDASSSPMEWYSIWNNAMATANLRIHPGHNKLVIRLIYDEDIPLPVNVPTLIITSEYLKDDPISHICD